MALAPDAMKIAIIDNAIEPSIYRPTEHWGGFLKAPWKAFTAREGSFPDLREGYTHLLLTGSEASILDREPWAMDEVELIREALDRGLPVLGSCYGHQLLALAIAGPARVGRCPDPEIGWVPVRILGSGGLLGRPRTAYAFSLHFDEVRGLDSSFEVLAATDICPVQAFRWKGRPVWGIQLHPEIDPGTGREFLSMLIRSDFKGQRLMEKALESAPRDSGLIRTIVRNFLKASPCRPKGWLS